MFLVFSGVYTLCAMGSLAAADPSPKVEAIEAPQLTVTQGGIRNLQLGAGTIFTAKPSPSSDVFEVTGRVAAGHVAGVLKVDSDTKYAFSGTIFLKSGQRLTTQMLNILPSGEIQTTDLVTEESYTFTREEAFKGTNAQMSQGQVSALCAVLCLLSVTMQP